MIRTRRNRKHAWLRDLVSESAFHINDLIYPIFISDQTGPDKVENALPVLTIEQLIRQVSKAQELGIRAISLFPKISDHKKSPFAQESFNPGNLVCQAVRILKEHFKNDIGVICDVALDPYTSHGHDGILNPDSSDVDNDETLKILAQQALSLAESGADFIAPSDMMDGRIGYLRAYLDKHNFQDIGIISYAAKYASKFYAPFRATISSNTNATYTDKSTYQMDVRNSIEAMRQIQIDINEAADIILIKPAIFCLDIIANAKQNFDIPIFAYQVSAEYVMLKDYAQKFGLDFASVLLESLFCIKRAGAKSVFSYGAIEIANFLKD